MCNGVIVGFYWKNKEIHEEVLLHWNNCSMTCECIDLKGSSRINYRQDQAALRIIMYIKGISCRVLTVNVLTVYCLNKIKKALNNDWNQDCFTSRATTPIV